MCCPSGGVGHIPVISFFRSWPLERHSDAGAVLVTNFLREGRGRIRMRGVEGPNRKTLSRVCAAKTADKEASWQM